MFDYTKAALNKIVNDFQKLGVGLHLATQTLTIAYLVYALCTGSGVLLANAILLALACAYLVFFLYVSMTNKEKKLKKQVKEIYDWCRRGVRLLAIGITIYGLVITSSDLKLLPLLFLVLTIVGWGLELLIYIIRKFIEAEIKLFMEGLKADYEIVMKPVNAVKSFLQKMRGKAGESTQEPNKDRSFLDKIVAKKKAEKRRERMEKATDIRSKISLWWQDKMSAFKKNPQTKEEDFEGERIHTPLEEELSIDVTPPWDVDED
ncbi:MAG: hypothetical protein IJW96_05460 [Clostridia bacterium]|nr:hypothetical protein [Clostridia bacterium]